MTESYDNGMVNVIGNHVVGTVVIKFVDINGVPPNLTDLQAAARAIVPAHLEIQYEFDIFL